MNLLAATQVTPKILCSLQIAAANAAQAVYTVPASTATTIKHGALCNTGAAGVAVTIAVVPSGGAADATHRVLSAYALAAGASLGLRDYLDGACLSEGDSISVTCDTAAVLAVVLTGTESS